MPKGRVLYLKEVAEVEFGSEFYDIYSNLDNKPSAAITLKQTYGSNASEVIDEVKAKLEEIKAESFPPGMDYEISYDVSNFLDASIDKVVHTLGEAFILVALVVFLFLGRLAFNADSDLGGPCFTYWRFYLHAILRTHH